MCLKIQVLEIHHVLTIYGIVGAFIGSSEQSSLILSYKKGFLSLAYVSQFQINMIYLILKIWQHCRTFHTPLLDQHKADWF